MASTVESLTFRRLETFSEMLAMLPLLQQLNPQLTPELYTERLQAIIAQGNYFQLGCFEGERCVGLTGVWIGTQLWCGKYLEVDNFVVDQAVRGCGIGERLLQWVEDLARREKCAMLRLDSYVTMDRTHKFYFAHGFKIEGFHMTKRLGE